MASRSPAATICPPPLSLAATSPKSAIACKTTWRSPPRTAAIPAGVIEAAFAISIPRARTNFIASNGVSTPAIAAAVISPTECPATKLYFPCALKARALSNPAATISGCALAVSLISSASAVVPKWIRSRSIASDHCLSKFFASASSSHDVSIPGVCEPCPGAMIASTWLIYWVTNE